ncbi:MULTISPECIES: ABC transporter ATP-binding protein [Clostridium]|uniref:ABC transporter ATP-binding protein n=1 Tax=Clostridium TaxID=1485 RepID=UPI001A9BAC78|nr:MULTISPECIES: ABC transporter ATP-binding protein [Clostridium]MDU1349751.1 ABC transporter ATP-binding protein [Clostridium argentinense]
MIILKTENLFAGYGKKVVVENVNISSIKGQVVCFLGPNGAGKTTILRTLSGLLDPVKGEVYIKEEKISNINKKDLSKQLAVVLTKKFEGGLMTCYEVVSMGRYPHTGFFGRLSQEDNEKVFEALKTVNAENLAERYFDELSDGEKQKILVARALVQEPEVIILDEPTTHLDIRHRLELVDILKKLSKEKGIAVILSLHEIDIAIKSCDKVILVKDNKVLAYGVPEDVVNENIIKKLYGIQDASFNNLLGSIELSNKLKPQVFVIGGSGYGAPIYRALTKQGIGVATGIIHENDIDYEIARTIGIHIQSERPFEAINDISLAKCSSIIDKMDIVIDSGYPIGEINRKNSDLIYYALNKGKKVLTLRDKFKSIEIYGNKGDRLIYCDNIAKVIENFCNVTKEKHCKNEISRSGLY